MYLTEPRLTDIVRKQLEHKFKAYHGVFTTMIVMQVIGMFFSFNAGGGSSSSDFLQVSWNNTSSDSLFVFTLIWAFTSGVLMTTLAYRNDAFSFVSTRFSHFLSSSIFIVTASVIGGIAAVLGGPMLQFFLLFRSSPMLMESSSFWNEPVAFLTMIATSILYTILFASFGFFIGSGFQKSKGIVLLFLVLPFIYPIFFDMTNVNFIGSVAGFFGSETSLLLFTVKIIVTAGALFSFSYAFTRKLEVR